MLWEHAAFRVHCRRTVGARKLYARRPAILSNNRACSDTYQTPRVRPWPRRAACELPSVFASGRPYTRRIRGVYAIRPDMFSVGRGRVPRPEKNVWMYRVYTPYTSMYTGDRKLNPRGVHRRRGAATAAPWALDQYRSKRGCQKASLVGERRFFEHPPSSDNVPREQHAPVDMCAH